jgi:hypothetical protein
MALDVVRERYGRLYALVEMTAAKWTPRSLGVDAETLSRWSSRGLLRAHELRGVKLRPGCWDDAPVVDAADAPTLLCGGDDLVPVRARPVD